MFRVSQVPTSSQRDQDDYNIVVVDSEDDDEMPDEGPVEPDDAPFEDDGDNVEQFDMEDGQAQDAPYDGDAVDAYGEQMQSGNNEVDVEDSSEQPNQSENQSHVAASDVGTSQSVGHSSSTSVETNVVDDATNVETNQLSQQSQPQENQQSQTISSGSDAAGTSSSTTTTTTQQSSSSGNWRQNNVVIPQRPNQALQQGQSQTPQAPQQPTQQNLVISYEEGADDSIVPSTPTLYVPRRADGFSEAVSSPHPQLQQTARFTFAESNRTASGSVATEEVPQADAGPVDDIIAPPTILLASDARPGPSETTSSSTSAQSQAEPIAGTSRAEASVPEVAITEDAEGNDALKEQTKQKQKKL